MILQEIDLFKGVDIQIMEEIVSICSEETYPVDTMLFRQGTEADALYILQEGIVQLLVENGGTISFTLDEPGEVFGWSSMVESGHYTASGVCSEDVKALRIRRDDLYKIFQRHPDVGLIVLKRLAGVITSRLTGAYQDLLSSIRQDAAASYG